MAEFSLNYQNGLTVATELDAYKSSLGKIQSKLTSIANNLSNTSDSIYVVKSSILSLSANCGLQKSKVENLSTGLCNCIEQYIKTESEISGKTNSISGAIKLTSSIQGITEGDSGISSFAWENIVDAVGEIGVPGSVAKTIIETSSDLMDGNGFDWGDVTGILKDTSEVIGGVAESISENGFDWKSFLGIDAKGATSWGDAFDSKIVEKYVTGTNGVAKAAAWAGVIFTAAGEFYENVIQNEENNSTWRALEETVGETVLKLGEGAVIGAGMLVAAGAITAATGVAIPALAVGVATIVATNVVDAAANWLTKRITHGQKDDWIEAVSDSYLDLKESVGDAIKNTEEKIEKGVKAITSRVSKFFNW